MLAELRVVEFATSMKGAYCGWLFAQTGARVARLPYPRDTLLPDVEAWLTMGKEDFALEAAAYLDRGCFEKSMDGVDVLIVDLRSPANAQLLARIVELERRLAGSGPLFVFVSDLPGVDFETPLVASDLIVSALSGLARINASETSPPLREPGNQTYLAAGLAAYFGALTSLVGRERSNSFEPAVVSALSVMVNVLSPQVLQHEYQGSKPLRVDDGRGYLFPCKDGWVSIVISSVVAWTTVTQVWGISGWQDDERLNTEAARRKNMPLIHDVLRPHLMSRTRTEVFEELAPMRVVCGYAASPGSLLEDRHLKERETFIPVADASDRRVPRLPIRVVATSRFATEMPE